MESFISLEDLVKVYNYLDEVGIENLTGIGDEVYYNDWGREGSSPKSSTNPRTVLYENVDKKIDFYFALVQNNHLLALYYALWFSSTYNISLSQFIPRFNSKSKKLLRQVLEKA